MFKYQYREGGLWLTTHWHLSLWLGLTGGTAEVRGKVQKCTGSACMSSARCKKPLFL